VEIVSLVEIQFPTQPWLRVATMTDATGHEVTDENGKPYRKKLVGHPIVQASLSDRFYGVIQISDITITIANLDQAVGAMFRSPDPRGVRVLVRRKRLDTGDVVIRTVAIVQSVGFAADGNVVVTAGDMATDVLNTQYPRDRIGVDLVGVITDLFAVGTTVSTVVGAVREHVPCRFVEATEASRYYRFLACRDFSPLSASGRFPPLIRPYVNVVYAGVDGGAQFISPAEYEQEWDSLLPILVPDAATTLALGGGPLQTTPEAGTGSDFFTTDHTWQYQVVAYNGYGQIAVSPIQGIPGPYAAGVSFGLRWGRCHGASFYRVWRGEDGGTMGILATLYGGPPGADTHVTPPIDNLDHSDSLATDTSEFLWWRDTGTRTPFILSDTVTPDSGPLPLPSLRVPNWSYNSFGTNWPSQPNFVSVIMRRPQGLPVLADLELSELGPSAFTTMLCLFRGDMRNYAAGTTVQRQNILRTSRHVHLWTFEGTFASGQYLEDSIGTYTLTSNVLLEANLVAGAHVGNQAINFFQFDLAGSGSYAAYGRGPYLLRADSSDMEYLATTSFRVSADLRPTPYTDDRTMFVCGKGANPLFTHVGKPGWALLVDRGAAALLLCDGAESFLVRGTIVITGGFHTIAGEVDRVNGIARVFVDDVLEAERDIRACGSLVTDPTVALDPPVQLWGIFRIGVGESEDANFDGQIDRVEVLTGFGSPWTFGQGKADSGINSIDTGQMWEVPWCSAPSGADPGTQDAQFAVWFYPNSTPIAGGQVLLSKTDFVNGWDLAIQTVGGIVKASAHVHLAGTAYTLTGTTPIVLRAWNLMALRISRVGTLASLYVNGTLGASVAIPSSGAIACAAPLIVGALNAATGACQFDGRIDEFHLEVGISTGIDTDATDFNARGLFTHRHCWFMGMRNGIRQLRSILQSHNVNAPLDAATGVELVANNPKSWDLAENAFAAVMDTADNTNIIKSDFAMVEPNALRLHIGELLRLRGARIGFTAAGTWSIVVDQLAAVAATFRWEAVFSNLLARPAWSQGNLKEAIHRARVNFRRTRGGAGDPVAYLQHTNPRDVLVLPSSEPLEITPLEFPALREPATADLVADYTTKWMRAIDSACAFSAEIHDAWSIVVISAVARLIDPTAGASDTTRLITGYTDSGQTVDFDTAALDPAIYTYTPAASLVNPQIEVVEAEIVVVPENKPDFRSTPPNPVSLAAVAFDADRLATVSWTPPAGQNYFEGRVEWRRQPPPDQIALFAGSVFSGPNKTYVVVTGLPPTTGDQIPTFEFEIRSRNEFGLLSIPVIVEGTPD